MQHFDVLNQPRIDEVTGSIGKASDVEMVRQRHTVHYYRNAIAAYSSNVYAFGTEPCTGSFVVDARDQIPGRLQ